MIRADRRPKQILITGGAGFIGSHLTDRLLAAGHAVRVLDSLSEQVHGPGRRRPTYLDPRAELRVGDVRDADAVREALRDVDVVYHLAAAVGVGQSMYEIESYTSVNDVGTAVLLEALIERPVERLVVASSMSVYGEGLYRNEEGEVVAAAERTAEALKDGRWEPRSESGEALTPVPTLETKPPSLASVYALTKYDQERMCLIAGRAYNIPTVALRLFNVYGTRQALSNPYTGVLAIFLSRLRNDRPPLIYEDGLQQRDFVSVKDVARAFHLAMDVPDAAYEVFNVGSGSRFTIREIAERTARAVNKAHLKPKITGKYRVGDIRNCFADVSKARRVLGYRPRVTLEDGLAELATWLEDQAAQDRVDEAYRELETRGLAV